jgi:hypothetical protein
MKKEKMLREQPPKKLSKSNRRPKLKSKESKTRKMQPSLKNLENKKEIFLIKDLSQSDNILWIMLFHT